MLTLHPGSGVARALLIAALLALTIPALSGSETAGTALVRHAPTINGNATVDGSVQQMLPENVTFNGGATVTGDLLLPGTPMVRKNGRPSFGGTTDLDGSASPSNYQVTLNGRASLRYVVRRVDPFPLPTVSAPPLPQGTRSVHIHSAGQSVGDWATLRDLTLNGEVGDYVVPPGIYGNFTANGNTSFALGIAGTSQPAVYHFQRLTLNARAQIRVLGPVVITLAHGLSGNGAVGSSANPSWLALNIYSGGLTLNGGCSICGFVQAPNGTVIINGGSQLIGGVTCDRLIINGGGLLRLFEQVSPNQAPIANPQSVQLDEDAVTTITLTGSDPEEQPLSYAIATPPSFGTLVPVAAEESNPQFRYTPDVDYHGSDSFAFAVSDGDLTSSPATVAIAVHPVNDAPVALPVDQLTNEDTPVAITLTGNDVEFAALSFTIVTPPTSGTLVAHPDLQTPSSATFTYTPNLNHHGPDHFTYVVSDGALTSAPVDATITILPVNDAPVARGQNVAANEDTPASILLEGADVDGDTLTFEIIDAPSSGTLSGDPPQLTYQPEPDFAGVDMFTFRVRDAALASVPAAIVIDVNNENDAPTAPDLSVRLDEDTAAGVTLAGEDKDGDVLIFEIVTPPAHGSLMPSGSGSTYTYTPDPNYFGPDVFTYRADDQLAQSAAATVELTILPVNDAPVGLLQELFTDEDTAIAIPLTGFDVEGSALTFAVVVPPGHGELVLTDTTNASASFTYTPVANYSGGDSFAFTVADRELTSPEVIVPITIAPVNDAPTVNSQSGETDEDEPLALTLHGDDGDNPAADLEFVIVAPPQHGTLTPTTPPAAFTYTPEADFSGSDAFTFKATDGLADSAVASFAIAVAPVNDAPISGDQEIPADRNHAIGLTLSATDVDGDAVTYSLASYPEHGALSGADGPIPPSAATELLSPNLVYTPEFNFTGIDTFSFVAHDGQVASNVASVTIDVRDTNRDPVAQEHPPLELDEDTSVAVVLSATDDDGDALTYIVTQPTHGTLTGLAPDLFYQPYEGYSGPDSFSFHASDGRTASNTVVVAIIVRPVNDAPQVNDVAVSTHPNQPVDFTVAATDADGDTLTLVLTAPPTHGELTPTGPQFLTPGTPSISFRYVPDEHYAGADAIAFTVSDGIDSPVPGMIAVTVENRVPAADDSTVNVVEDMPTELVLSATDPDGQPLTYAIVTGPTNGTLAAVSGSPTSSAFLYTPNADFDQADSFTFRANDGYQDSNVATVTVAVEPVNDRPIALPQSLTTRIGEPLTVRLAAEDRDGDILSFVVAKAPLHGSLSGSVPDLTYVAEPDFVGSDTLAFKVFDGREESKEAKVEIAVQNDPLAPIITSDPVLRIVLSAARANESAAQFTPIELTPADVGSASASVFSTLPTADPALFGFSGSDIRKVNFDVRPDGIPISSGSVLTNEYESVGVRMSSIVVSSSVYGGPASWPNTTFGPGIHGAKQVYTFTVPVVAVGVINTSPDQDGIEYYSPQGTLLFSTRDHAPHPNTDRFVGARVNDGNLIGSLVLINNSGLTELDEMIFEVLTHAIYPGQYIYDVEAIDPANLDLAFSLSAGPDGMTIDSSTGLIHWAPQSGNAGLNPVTVEVRNSVGLFDTQSFAIEVIVNQRPLVSAGPDLVLREPGGPLVLRGMATDDMVPTSGPLDVAWSVLSGPGAVSLDDPGAVQPAASFSAEGIYVLQMTVSDGLDEVTDIMEVRVGAAAVEPRPGMVAWWPANSHVHEVVNGNHDVDFGGLGAQYGPGKVSDGFVFNGVSDWARVAAHPHVDVGASSAGFTIEFWVKPERVSPPDYPLFAWQEGATRGVHVFVDNYGRDPRLHVVDTTGADHTLGASLALDGEEGNWVHLAYTYDRTTGIARCFKNATIVSEGNIGTGYTPRTNLDLWMGSRPDSMTFKGTLDEFTLYDRPLTANELAEIFAAGAQGKAPPDDNLPPTVDAGPDVTIPDIGAVAVLMGSITDDGRPIEPPAAHWTLVAGPGDVSFHDASDATTTATFTMPGTYVLALAGSDGLNAPVKDLTEVRVGVATVEPPAGIAAWWPLNGHVHEVVNGNHDIELLNGAGFDAGHVAQGLRLDGGNDRARVPAHADLDLGESTDGFTIELWFRSDAKEDGALLSYYGDGARGLYLIREWFGQRLSFAIYDSTGVEKKLSTGDVLLDSVEQWRHLAVTYDRHSGRARLYLDGIIRAETMWDNVGASTLRDLYIGRLPDGSRLFRGVIDEIGLYRRALTFAEIGAIYAAGVAGKCPPDDNSPPLVNAGPDIVLSHTSEVAMLAGEIVDDNRPLGPPVALWSVAHAPQGAVVAFGDPGSPSTTATFTLPGTYVLRLSGSDRLLKPESDLVEVRVQVAAVSPPAGIAAWWPLNGHVHEVVNGNHDVELLNGAAFEAGHVAQGLRLDGGNDRAVVPAHADLDLGASATGFTIDLWFRSDAKEDGALLSYHGDTGRGLYLIREWFGQRLSFGVYDENGVERKLSTGDVLLDSNEQWHHVVATYDRASGTARIYLDGVVRAQTTSWGNVRVRTDRNLQFGLLPNWNRLFSGVLDEITMYQRPLDAAEVAALYAAGAAGKLPLGLNQSPIVSAGSDRQTQVAALVALAGFAVDDGLPNPPGALSYSWSKLSGPGEVMLSDPDALVTTASFGAVGTYVLRLTVSDADLSASDDVMVNVTHPPPSVVITSPEEGGSIVAGRATTLTAVGSYTGGPIVRMEFYADAALLGEGIATSDPDTFSFVVSDGFAVGSHLLAARATVADGGATTSEPVRITVVPPAPPEVAIISPADGATLAGDRALIIRARAASAGGIVGKVEFFRDDVRLGQASGQLVGEPDTYGILISAGFPAGTYQLTARATDNLGISNTSDAIGITVIDDPGVPPEAFIASPTDGSRISSPNSITGVVYSPILASWRLEYRLKPAEGSETEWLSLASGSANVGTPASESTAAVTAELGVFDPTLLLNGVYELRLSATDYAGITLVDGPITVVVEGNMKVGAFSLVFEDLSVPIAGIPISITRTYDSRDARVGDFGPGWNIAVNNIRVQKNRHFGRNWWQTPQSGLPQLQFFDVLPIAERIVTIVFPDGETHRFRAGALVKNRDFDPDSSSWGVLVREGKYRFYPIGDTASTLEPLDASNQLAEDFWLNGTGYQDLYAGNYLDTGPNGFPVDFNPTRFRLTTKDGAVFIVDERLGLLEMHDRNGNKLELTRDAQDRVTAIVSTQDAPQGPIVSTVSVHRDNTGRVDYITDLVGASIDYTYDAQGRLEAFTDRELNVTQFRYENPTFPHYLTRIIDPRGITAIRSEYDEAGRLVKQIDPDGKETIFNHGVDASGRFERIKDRLGHETAYYYDDRGNVTLKIDPLGAQTSYSYYPDSDRVKYETDHYGNTKSFAYDARGNVTVETLGASLADDPANPTTGFVTRTIYNSLSAPTELTDPDGRVQTFTYEPGTSNLTVHTTGLIDPLLYTGEPAPSTTTYTYHDDGTINTITDGLGNVTSHAYEYGFSDAAYPGAVKRITMTVTDPAGTAGSDPHNATDTILRITRSLYDAQENAIAEIVTRTAADGAIEEIVTRHRYDAENRLVATILPDGRVNETRYESFGKEDAVLLWRTVADYESGDDTLARITDYAYDARGNRTGITYADGSTEAMAFDAENRKLWSQDRRGYRTFFEYDAVGRLTATIFPDDNDGVGAAAPVALDDPRLADNPRTTTIYDRIGRVRFQIDEEGATTEFTYEDNCGCAMRRKEMIQHLPTGNVVTSYEYDRAGNVRFVTDSRDNTVETRYDAQGRPVTVIYPPTDEHPATQAVTTYDVRGRRVAMTDQEGRITRFRYDGLGRLVEVRQYLDQTLAASDADFHLLAADPSVIVTSYAYDGAGNQTAQTDALGRTTSYETDTLGRRTKRILPKDASEPAALFETMVYDAWGNLWKRTDFAGHTTTFEYDTMNRLTAKIADPGHPSLVSGSAIARIEYEYDAAGQREAARTYRADGGLLYSERTPHDPRGRVDYKETDGAITLDYDYLENNLLKDVVSSTPGGVNTGYRYDALNRLAFVDDATTGTVRTSGYTYNPNGSLESITYANGIVHQYSYDSLNRLRHLEVKVGIAVPGGPPIGTVVHTYEYKLRASGHRQQAIESLNAGTTSCTGRTITYEYDQLYRLTAESILAGIGDAGPSGSIGYSLDKVGNRLSRVTTGNELQLKLPISTSAYNARDWLDTDTYDANGNTEFSPGLATHFPLLATFHDTYDFEDRLVRRTRADGSVIHLHYDADGNRIGKTIVDAAGTPLRATSYLVDTNNLTGYAQVLEERTNDASGTTLTTYTYGSDLISRTSSSVSSPPFTAYYLYDGHGSVRELTDTTGAVTDRYDYDAFGNLITVQSYGPAATANNYLYCGEQCDADLGLYFLRARYMNPDSGRFWSADSFEGRRVDPTSLHKYLFASANAVSLVDPSGRFALGTVMLGLHVRTLLTSLASFSISFAINTGIQAHTLAIAKPLAEELDLLALELGFFHNGAAAKVSALADVLRALIAPGQVTKKIFLPAALAALPPPFNMIGIGLGVLKGSEAVLKVYEVAVASAYALSFESPLVAVHLEAKLRLAVAGLRVVTGARSPARDIAPASRFLADLRSGNYSGARDEFGLLVKNLSYYGSASGAISVKHPKISGNLSAAGADGNITVYTTGIFYKE